jgi:TPP-dependent pyruvate/acetoin dehydrogenase alpha subunit
LHAAGIAFASKLRKAPVVTVAYCDDSVTTEADFHEGLRFAALHQLPVVFVCEYNCVPLPKDASSIPSCLEEMTLPNGLTHHRIDGSDVVAVYTAMHAAMQHAREQQGPVLLEMSITRTFPPFITSSTSHTPTIPFGEETATRENDPLIRCQLFLEQQGVWESEWAHRLYTRLSSEVEQAMHDAMQDNCYEQDKANRVEIADINAAALLEQ